MYTRFFFRDACVLDFLAHPNKANGMDSRNSPRLASSLSHINQSIKHSSGTLRCPLRIPIYRIRPVPFAKPATPRHGACSRHVPHAAPGPEAVSGKAPAAIITRAPLRNQSASLPLAPTDRPRPDLAAAAFSRRQPGSIGAGSDRVSSLFFPRRLAGTWGQRPRTRVWRYRTSCLLYVYVLLM